MNTSEIIAELQSLGSQANREGMAHFGIETERALGVSMISLRQIARRVGRKDHALAQKLWDTGIHEARILASIVDDPRAVTVGQMQRLVAETVHCTLEPGRSVPYNELQIRPSCRGYTTQHEKG